MTNSLIIIPSYHKQSILYILVPAKKPGDYRISNSYKLFMPHDQKKKNQTKTLKDCWVLWIRMARFDERGG
jgi:hypothetical protein